METPAEYATPTVPKSTIEIVEMSRELGFKTTGLYFLIYGSEIVYVGQTKASILSRLAFHEKDKIFDRITILQYPIDCNLDAIEAAYIYHFEPRYNSTLPPNSRYMTLAMIGKYLNLSGRELTKIALRKQLQVHLKNYWDIRDFQEHAK